MPRKLTTQQVIEQFKRAHGDLYDYSLVEYKNNRKKVSILCKEHGIFKQLPADHKSGVGCIQCGYNSTKSKRAHPQDNVIKEFKKAHGNRYDYSEVKYINSKIPVLIICKEHGAFFQKPEFHKVGHGCPQCGMQKNANKKRLDQNDIINRFKNIHKNKYDYSRVKYINYSTSVEIICKKHGIFLQSPNEHMRGANCPTCAFSNKRSGSYYTKDRLIKDFRTLHGDLYIYDKVNFTRVDKPICIICRKHGEFEQLPYIHKNGSGCPTCAGQNLNTEKIVFLFYLFLSK